MLDLENSELWSQLDTPFGNASEIPALLIELQTTYSIDVLDTLCWEYLYHQNTLYSATFATIPYLVSIAENSNDLQYQLYNFYNLSWVLSELDEEHYNCSTVLRSINDEVLKAEICQSYHKAFDELKVLGECLLNSNTIQHTIDSLIGLAVINKYYSVAKVFTRSSQGEEFNGICPHCESEFWVVIHDNQFSIVLDSEVLSKKAVYLPVFPNTNLVPSSIVDKSYSSWIPYYIDKLNIEELLPIKNHLFGTVQCPACKKEFDLFNALLVAVN